MLAINWGNITRASEFLDAAMESLGPGKASDEVARIKGAMQDNGIYTFSQLKILSRDDIKAIFLGETPPLKPVWIDTMEGMLGFEFDHSCGSPTNTKLKKSQVCCPLPNAHWLTCITAGA